MRTRLARPRPGQSAVELALVLPIFLWILLGVVDFGRAYSFSVAATNAAREGARYWASNPAATSTAVKTRVQNEAAPQVTIDAARITLTTPSVEEVRVQVQYAFEPLTPLIGTLWGGGSLWVTTQAQMPKLAP